MRLSPIPKVFVVILAAATLIPVASAAHRQTDQTPVPWGMVTQNTSCVIFSQHRVTHGMFWGVAVTAKRYSVLDVVESHNYTLPQKAYKEDQATLDQLQGIATNNRVKFINIPGKVTAKELKEARQMCQSDAAPQYASSSGS